MIITFTTTETWLRAIFPQYSLLQYDKKALGQAVKDVVKQALYDGVALVDPGPEDDAVRVRIPLSFPEPAAGVLRMAAADAGLGVNQYLKQLVGTLAKRPPLVRAADMGLSINQLVHALSAGDASVKERPEQVRMFVNLRDALERGMIGLIEAGTGVGKTRSTLCCAADWVAERGSNVVIAAPTIALLRQYAAEWAVQNTARNMPPLRMVFGKREFVSAVELARFMESPAAQRWDCEPLRRWIAERGQPLESDAGISTPWLCHTLEHIVPGFPLDEVRLSDISTESDPGLVAYRAQFEGELDDGEVFVCTHAMLAQHMRMRMIAAGRDEDFAAVSKEINDLFGEMKKTKTKSGAAATEQVEALQALYVTQGDAFKDVEGGLLPMFRALFIDEAHVLEEQFSNALTEYLSLQSIKRWLEAYRAAGGRVSKSAMDNVRACIGDICKAGMPMGDDVVNLASSHESTRSLKSGLSLLATELAGIAMPKQAASSELLMAAAHLRRAGILLRIASGNGEARSYLRFSPVRAYPQLYIGRSNVSNILTLMWNGVDAGAAISATLYLNTGNEQMSAFYQKSLLSIPPARVAEYPPIEAPWLREPVQTLWVPDEETGKGLRPPSKADRLTPVQHAAAEQVWLGHLSATLQRIHAHASGGVLVLMTAYAHIKAVRDQLLASHPDLALVVADGDTNVTQQKRRFLEIAAAGGKPLWLAVGAAWTGLDVGGHEPWKALFGRALDAKEDNVLTTLVIPRLPFGTNNTITHLWRKNNRPGTPWELFEAAFRFKQGLGRLIRRMGLPNNREIYVLDGRLCGQAFSRAMPLFEKIMAKYPVKKLGWGCPPVEAIKQSNI